MKQSLIAIALIIVSIVSSMSVPTTPIASAAVAGNFKAGRIIDDAIMFNEDAMSVDQIQAFLNSELAKVGACQTNRADDPSNWRDMGPPYVCLKDYRENPAIAIRNCTQSEVQSHFGFGSGDSRYTTALTYCWWKDGRANIKGQAVDGSAQSAALIIWRAGQDYGINPRALLVMLQKEQSLITDVAPWVGQLGKAMGYACPDTGDCNPVYRGFYNQVRSAAFQIRRYVTNAGEYNYIAGQTNNIKYHPNAACGTKSVFIENAATAGLYNYTPYTPNEAALNNLYSTGDGCSSYGNRNFWRLFTDWFGSPNIDHSKDQPIVGDWDGDGDDTVSVKRGNFYVIDNNGDGRAETSFYYGSGAEVPIAGDWDGDGDDTIGLRIKDKVFINNELDGSSAFRFLYGTGEETFVVGDWDNDGDDTVSLRLGHKIFINNNHDSYNDFAYSYASGVPLVAGDWDGDGDDTVSMRSGAKIYINNQLDPYNEFAYTYGNGSEPLLTGDWDNNNVQTHGLKVGLKYFLNNLFDSYSDYTLYFHD